MPKCADKSKELFNDAVSGDCPHDGSSYKVAVVKKFDCITAMKALAEESRLRIVRLLLSSPRNVGELAEALGITQYNVSKHLRVLRDAGLLAPEKQAQQRVYALAPQFSEQLKANDNVLDLGCCQFDFNKIP